ncbi:MAG: hypothetical protein RL308_1307 [Bacteroidota bacterium]|jgi:hypothetical protein
MNKINFRIKIEIFTFTKQGRENIIDKKIIENSINGLIGFLSKYKIM